VASASSLPDRARAGTGAPPAPCPDAVPPALASLREGADCVLVDGHHAPLALAVARAASARGLELVVDAGRPKPVFDALWPLAGTAICAEGYGLEPGAPAARTAEARMALGVRRVALTAGSGPIRWWVSDPRGDEPGSGEIRPRSVRAVDTLGAGDVLHGAYCAVRNRRRASFADHLRAAADLATERTRHEGLSGWLAALARDTRRRVRWS